MAENNSKSMGILDGVGTFMSGASSLMGAFGAMGARRRQREMIDYQYQKEEAYQKKMSQFNWDNFNSPAAQRRALQAAGINPFVDGSSVGPMQMDSSAPGPDFQEPANPLGGVASALQAGASSLFQMNEARRVNDSIINKNNAEANQANANATGQDNLNSIFPVLQSIKESEASSAASKAIIDSVEASVRQATQQTDIARKDAELYRAYAEINKLIASADLDNTQKENLIKQRDLIGAQITTEEYKQKLMDAQTTTEGSKQRNLDAQTETEGYRQTNLFTDSLLKSAQAITEDDLREGRKSLLDLQGHTEKSRKWALDEQAKLDQLRAIYESDPSVTNAKKLEQKAHAIWSLFFPKFM